MRGNVRFVPTLKLWHLFAVVIAGALYIHHDNETSRQSLAAHQAAEKFVPFLNSSINIMLAQKDIFVGVIPQRRSAVITEAISKIQLADEQKIGLYNLIDSPNYSMHFDTWDNFLGLTVYYNNSAFCKVISRAIIDMKSSHVELDGVSWFASSSQRVTWDATGRKPIEVFPLYGVAADQDPMGIPTEAQVDWACSNSDNISLVFNLND